MPTNKLYEGVSDWLQSAVETLSAAGMTVIAPTQGEPGVVNLTRVTSAEAIAERYDNTLLPLKGQFFPITETLLEFERCEDGDVEIQTEPLPAPDEVIVLGCRPCDAAAMGTMDKVFQWDYDDVRYRARRDRATLVAFACTTPSPECFCTSVGGSPHGDEGSDVLVFGLGGDDSGGRVLLKVNTDKGRQFIDRLGDRVRPASEGVQPPSPPELARRFDTDAVKAWLDEGFDSDFWQQMALSCLGCGACSFLCPTCHCFDIVDEATWNRGQRRRNWDCCSFALFTLHASGHNPRPEQFSRCRQRIMHKFKYFPERFGRIACVGCGRCIRACAAGRSLAEVLTEVDARQKG